MNMIEQATDKQVAYLVRLARKVERLKRDDATITVPYINWDEERRLGVTKTDASLRIKAYKQLIRGANFKRLLLGRGQIV